MNMSSEEASCSDCKMEIYQTRWTRLLLHWINRCVNPQRRIDQIDFTCLFEIINNYKGDIVVDDTDRALLCSDDIVLFIKYKFPIARLGNLYEEKDVPKKLYIMATILLYYCCVNSQGGRVEADICSLLEEDEQEMILKFCEVLSECEVTINNIDNAIREACESTKKITTAERNIRKLGKRKLPKIKSDFESFESSISRDMSEIYQETKKTGKVQGKMDSKTREMPVIKFKSSITVLPSVVTDTSSYSKSSVDHFSDISDYNVIIPKKRVEDDVPACNSKDAEVDKLAEAKESSQEEPGDQKRRCQPECACTRCSVTGPCCGDPGSSIDECKDYQKKLRTSKDLKDVPCKRSRIKYLSNWKLYLLLTIGIILSLLLIFTIYMIPQNNEEEMKLHNTIKRSEEVAYSYPEWAWQCKNNLCRKVLRPSSNISIYNSLSRCTLLCSGPQLWPYPIGYTHFSKSIVALATNKLEYKFEAIPSDIVHQYLAEAFKLFLKDLVTLEKINTKPKNNTDLALKKISIQIEVESDTDPRMRTNTDETYSLKMDTKLNLLLIRIASPSFCGVRHGLETLSQLILLDQASGYLITVSSATIKDGPSYRYRGVMIDTARNFIPVVDLQRTIDAMASCKLNTLHWRISDMTSFPLHIPELPELFEYGPYDRSMVYMKEDVKSVVHRAGIRGIRVLIEVAMPGPVGRPWSWFPDASCSKKNDNYTCDNILCLKLKIQDSLFDTLQIIYSEILDLTKVDDIFHLSDGISSVSNCFYIIDNREGFLDKALERLKLANGGFLPKLPIIWYTTHLSRDFDARTWERLGVQLNHWNPNLSQHYLSKFRVIHSSKWDLSCQMKKKRCYKYRTWQEIYSWKTWRNLEVFTIEGGEAILWTDLVDSGNLDYHLWPRAAAVAERLWSDVVANSSATRSVYARLDTHRWRMLLRGVKVQPLWPTWCSFNPDSCLDKIY